jgi:hypothetical protein
VAFPADQLRPRGGEISALLWDNQSTRVPLAVYWSVRVDFEPLLYEGESCHPNLMVEWLELPIRDWRALESRDFTRAAAAAGVTFCTAEHDEAVDTTLRIGQRRGTSFDVEWSAIIDFPGWTGTDRDPRLPVRTRTTLPFVGVLVGAHVVEQSSSSLACAELLLSKFLDRSAFGSCVRASSTRRYTGIWLLPE